MTADQFVDRPRPRGVDTSLSRRCADRVHTIYTAYAKDGTCLYVGCTSDLGMRLTHHRSQSEWYPCAARIDLRVVETRAAALSLEAQTIRERLPLFNRMHHPNPHDDPWAVLCARLGATQFAS